MQIAMFPQWQELEAWLAKNEQSKFDLWNWSMSAPSEDLISESCHAYRDYVDVWGRIRNRHADKDEQSAIDRAVLFGCVWNEVSGRTLKSGKTLARFQLEKRVELELQPNAYTSDLWASLDFALSPQSVREICDAAEKFEIEKYQSRFYEAGKSAIPFWKTNSHEPAQEFENFRNYYASWRACFVEAAGGNCGLLVFGW